MRSLRIIGLAASLAVACHGKKQVEQNPVSANYREEELPKLFALVINHEIMQTLEDPHASVTEKGLALDELFLRADQHLHRASTETGSGAEYNLVSAATYLSYASQQIKNSIARLDDTIAEEKRMRGADADDAIKTLTQAREQAEDKKVDLVRKSLVVLKELRRIQNTRGVK